MNNPEFTLTGPHKTSLTYCVWSGNNELIVLGDSDGFVSRWKREDNGGTHRVTQEEPARVMGLGVSFSGEEVWAGFQNGSIWSFPGTYEDATPARPIAEKSRDFLSALALSPNGRRLAFTRNGEVTIVSFGDGGKDGPIGRGLLTSMFRMRWRGDGRYLATDDGREKVILWDTDTGQRAQVLDGPTNSTVSDIAFNYGGERVMVCYGSHPPREFDFATGRQLREIDAFPRKSFSKCQYGPGRGPGTLILSNFNRGGSLVIADFAASKIINEVNINRTQFTEIMISPKADQLLVAAEDGNAYGWFFKDLL